jgi:hypothetical protein
MEETTVLDSLQGVFLHLRTMEHNLANLNEDIRNAYQIFVGKPEGKRPLGIPIRRREDNIKMYLNNIGYEVVKRIQVSDHRVQW